MNVDLESLRTQIDDIDEQLMTLLMERCQYVDAVGKIKSESGNVGSFIRPKRESDMIKKIVARFEESCFSEEAAANIWRNIIGASLVMESPLNIATHCPDGSLVPYFMSREYFGSFVPSAIYQDASQILQAIQKNEHTVGVVSLADTSSSNPWWLQIAEDYPNASIFACIPFVQKLAGTAAENPFIAISQVQTEETDSDISYLVVHFEYPHPDNASQLISEWLASGDFRAKSVSTIDLSEDRWASLIKLQGYAGNDTNNMLRMELENHLMQMSDGALQKLTFIGSHATPCIIK